MKIKTRVLSLLLSFAMVLSFIPAFAMTAYAEGTTYTKDIVFSNHYSGTIVNISTLTVHPVTVTFSKGSATVPPRYYGSNKAIMFFSGSTFTVSVPKGKLITNITWTTNDKNTKITHVNTTGGQVSNGVWSGSAQSVTLKATDQLRLAELAVTYEDFHTHALNCNADGATITAECTAEDCDLPENKAELTIGAPTLTSYGQTGSNISAEAVITDPKNIRGDAEIIYYPAAKTDEGYTKNGDALTGAPTDAGDYVAEITLGTEGNSATASVGYTIAKAEPSTITPTGLSAILGETLADVTLPDGWAWVDPTIGVGNVGVNTFKANYTPTSANHDPMTDVDLKVTVTSVYAPLVNSTKTVKFNNLDWYVIADNSTARNAGTLTLFAKYPISKSQFNPKESLGNKYSTSAIKRELDELTLGLKAPTLKTYGQTGEGISAEATVSDGAFMTVANAIAPTELLDVGVTDAKLYLLSESEAMALNEDIRKCNWADGSVDSLTRWYLRTPGLQGNMIRCIIATTGNAFAEWVNGWQQIRPALRLDLSKVVFDADEQTFAPKETGNLGEIKYYNATKSGDIYTKAGDALSKAPTNAGDYVAEVKVTFGEDHKETASVGYTIAKAEPVINPPTGLTATYGQTLGDVPLINPEGNTPGAWTWYLGNTESVGNAGNRTFYARFDPNDNVNYLGGKLKELTITVNKANPTVTAPTAKTLTYTGSAQELVNAGSTDYGTMYYATTAENTAPADDNSYSTSIPTKTDSGTYYVWYKVVGNENYNDVAATSISVTIKSYYAMSNVAPTIELTKSATNTEANKPQVGDTLTAVTTPENAAPVIYEWYRGGVKIEGATDKDYTLTADDVDKAITVKATQPQNADGNGSAAVEPAVSQATAGIQRQDNTTTPIEASKLKAAITKTGTEIIITAPADGFEYAVVAKGAEVEDGTTWQSGNGPLTFENLSKGTEYDVLVRAEGTTGAKPGIPTKTTVTTNVSVAIASPVAEGMASTITIDPTPAGEVTYKWFRGDDLTNAISTEKAYVPAENDIGKKLTFKIYDANGDEIGVAVFGDDEDETVKSFNDYLNEQLNADPAPDTIKLDGSVTGPVTIPAGKQIVLDLNGNTITGGVTINGKAVIKDSTGDGIINGGITVNDGGEAAIKGGTINDGLNVKTGGKATVTGGIFSDPNVIKYIDKNDENADVAIKLAEDKALTPSPATLDIKGKITFDLNGHTLTGSINAGKNATLEIGDSEAAGKFVGNIVTEEGSTLIVKGGTIDGDVTNNGTATIKDGTFSKKVTNNSVITVNGGTFNDNATNSGTMIVDGGTIDGTGKFINEKSATMNVKKGTINVDLEGSGKMNIESGTFGGKITNNENGTLNINGGIFNNDVTNSDTMTVNGGVFKESVSSTENSKTTIKGGQFDNKPTASSNGSVSIESGKFKTDPTNGNDGVTLADSKQIFILDGKDYPYLVIDKPNANVAAIKVDQGSVTVTASENITDQSIVNSIENTVADIEEAAAVNMKQIVASSSRVTDSTKNIIIVPTLEITAQEYTVNGNDSTLTLDIEAVYTSYETDSSITTAAQIETADEGQVKEIGSGKLDTAGTSVDVKIEVPTAFAEALGATASSPVTVFVKHNHENENYEYRTNIYSDGGKYYLEFTNPNGFSTFTISKTGSSVVEANVNGETRYYTDLTTALNDIPDGATLTLTKNDMTKEELTAVINSTKEITIAKGDTNNDLGTLKIAAGSDLRISQTDNGDDTVTFKTTKRSGGGGGGGGSAAASTTYASSVNKANNGTVSVKPTSAKAGDTVTITAKPDKGYELDTVTVTDKDGNSVAVTKNEDGTYSYVQPAGKVDVTPVFVKEGDAPTTTPTDPTTPSAENENPFIDVKTGDYFYDPVLWAVKENITSGTTDTTFSPNESCTRGQTVTFLWRAAGSPEPTTAVNPFTDVKTGDYFYKAVLWAYENGITQGTSDTEFSPNATVTRGQTVTFLYRSTGEKTDGDNPFTDVSADDYYYDSVLWAYENDITSGTSDTAFSPNDNCLRGQIVTFLYRCNK